MEHAHHFAAFNSEQGSQGVRAVAEATRFNLIAADIFFAQKVSFTQQGNCRFFADFGNHSQLDLAFLDIKHASASFALGKDERTFVQIGNRAAGSSFG